MRVVVGACLFIVMLSAGCHSRQRPPRRRAAQPDAVSNAEAVAARHNTRWDEANRSDALEAGREALARFDCVRCHTVDDVPPAPLAENCVGCHAELNAARPGEPSFAALAARFGEANARRYHENVSHFVAVPDLTRVAARIRPAWILSFLLAPHDLRPSMDESMPRLAIQSKDAMVLARYFAALVRAPDPALGADAPQIGPRPSDADIARGAALFREHTCNTCHTLGNVETGKTAADLVARGVPARLAPNLRFARERMHRDVLEAWIRAPHAFHPGSLMPDLHVSATDAARLADFILFVDPRLEAGPKPPPFELPPPATHAVTWSEVNTRVFARSCVPCHMNNHELDPGPGNIGGFGWHAEHLQMRTYEGLVSGIGSAEYGVSALVPREGEDMAPVLEHMLIRRVENLADHIAPFHDHLPFDHGEAEPGMPMGMPALGDEEIGLVRAWIAEGCPGPTEVTGTPGVLDGYRVPDGPIAQNHGCERRAASTTRPAWASDRVAPAAGP